MKFVPPEPSLPLKPYLPEAPPPREIPEPARSTPVLCECDVAVFGGGSAGACAAAAAARMGKRVVLVERYGFLGGMVTAANVVIWHSLYGMDRFKNHDTATQVIGGLAEEAIRRLQKRGGVDNYGSNGETDNWVVCAETTKLVYDDMVIGSGVRPLYHTWLAGVKRNGRRIEAAFVENKAGRFAIVADTYIDCTGDADLVRRAGIATQMGDGGGHCQPATYCVRVGGMTPDAMGFRQIQAELFKGPMDYNGEKYSCFLWGAKGVRDKGEQMLAAIRVTNVDVSSATGYTKAEVDGRYQIQWLMKKLKTLPGWEKSYIVDIATQIGTRESHRILAEHQLSREELLHGVRFTDTIAQGTYPIDIHKPDGPGIAFEYLDGTNKVIHGDTTQDNGRWDGQPLTAPKRDTLCYCVPLRALIPQELDNVTAAGRCIGANHNSAGAIRVMINCMQFGEAAGVACALAGTQPVKAVPAAKVRSILQAAGGRLLPVE